MRALLWILVLSSMPLRAGFAQADLDAGQRSFSVCAGCHGFLGEGNALINAPRLGGIEDWYFARQMRNFAAGVRGTAAGDAHGQRMATMARAVASPRALDDVVAYVGTLPAGAPGATIAGDLEQGRRAYALCSACHGQDAQGDAATGAPGLASLDDWYVVEQLRLFAEGLRGTSAQYTYGQQMRALSATFASPEARRDLAAYIRSLRR